MTSSIIGFMNKRFPFIQRAIPAPVLRPMSRTTTRGVITQSPIERMFWSAYQRTRPRALRGLVQQYQVGRYRIDFALPKLKIGIELDGYQSHSSTISIAHDRARQRDLEAQGWYIIRFGGLEVHQNADYCVRQAARLAALRKMSRG